MYNDDHIFSGLTIGSALNWAKDKGNYEAVLQAKEKAKLRWKTELQEAIPIQNAINDIIEESQFLLCILKANPAYRTPTQMQEIQEKIGGNENFMTPTLQPNEIIKGQCFICYHKPDSVYVCQSCDDWICGVCLSKLNDCPHCRQDLKMMPMRRCKALERVIKD